MNSLSTFLIANSIALYFHWKLALVLMSFSPIILFSVFFEQKFTQGDSQVNQKFLENSAKVAFFVQNHFLYLFVCPKIAVEAIGNIRTVTSLGCEQVFYKNYVAELTPYVTTVRRQAHFRGLIMGIARSIMLFAYAGGLSYGAQLIIEESLHYGIVYK